MSNLVTRAETKLLRGCRWKKVEKTQVKGTSEGAKGVMEVMEGKQTGRQAQKHMRETEQSRETQKWPDNGIDTTTAQKWISVPNFIARHSIVYVFSLRTKLLQLTHWLIYPSIRCQGWILKLKNNSAHPFYDWPLGGGCVWLHGHQFQHHWTIYLALHVWKMR